jgi:hypothetical protein
MPDDYQQSFKMDFITYTGDTSDPMDPTSKLWEGIGKETWDLHQMLYITPLTRAQMIALGFDVTPVELSFFDVTRDGERATLSWQVAEASDHAGFNVHRQLPGDERERINDDLLRGQTTYEFVDEQPPAGEVDYWLEEISLAGEPTWIGPKHLAAAPPPARPGLTLSPADPNPFAASTRLTYVLPETRAVRLHVYDIEGRLVRVLLDQTQGPGSHEVNWDGRTAAGVSAASGTYLLRLDAGGETRVQKVLFMR